MSSVRDLVHGYQREIRDTDVQPERAAELLMKLTALLGNVLSEIREADYDYSVVLLRELESSEKANRATIRAAISPEYQRRQEARNLHALVVELVRSLKIFIKAQAEEMRLAR